MGKGRRRVVWNEPDRRAAAGRSVARHAARRELTIVDLGCGDATFLIDLVQRLSGVRGVGIEPDEVLSR
jgi:hypothetical protein